MVIKANNKILANLPNLRIEVGMTLSLTAIENAFLDLIFDLNYSFLFPLSLSF